MARVTQKTIAQKLGLSPSLVSRALSGTADAIGADPHTVRAIQDKARELGYVPSAAARQLRGAGQPVIGLAVADLRDPFFGPAVAEVITQCHRAGYALALTGFEQRQANPADVDLLLQHDLSALFVLGSGSMEWTGRFKERNIPMIRIGHGPRAPGVVDICHDEALGMKLIVDHLTKLGHRRFALAGARLPVHENRLRIARALLEKRHGKAPRPFIALGDGNVMQAGIEAAEQLAAKYARAWPTAVICSSDAVAMGVIRGADRHGVKVPMQVSVTGYDDLALAQLATPPLTSMRQPVPDMVTAAINYIQSERGTKPPAPLRPHLVVRNSTGTAQNNPS